MHVTVSQGFLSAHKTIASALQTTGATVVTIRKGEYRENLSFWGQVTLIGEPGATIVGELKLVNGARVRFEGLRLKGQINISGQAEAMLERVEIENTTLPALRIAENGKVTAHALSARSGGAVVYLTGDARGDLDGATLDGLQNAERYPAIAIDQRARATLSASTVRAASGNAIWVGHDATLSCRGSEAHSTEAAALRARL